MLQRACLWVLLALATLTSAPSFAGSTVSVTFINPGGSTSFWGDVSATMSAAAADLDIDLEIIHTNRDRLEMIDAANRLAARPNHPDFFIIVNELQQGPALLAALKSTNVPIFVLLNRMTQDQRQNYAASGGDLSRLAGSIVPDNEIAGYEMAVSIIEAARAQHVGETKLQMLALLGDAATPAALAREAGLMRALEENADVELVRAFPVMWSMDTAYERTGAVLRRFDLDAIWSANDEIALGAMRAAQDIGAAPGQDIVFAGLNWSDAGLAATDAGEMTLTHGGHFFAGAWSMVMIRDLVDGRLPMGSHIEFPMSAITAETAGRFRSVFGDRAWGMIDFRSFSLGATSAEGYSFTADAILAASQ